MAAQTNAVTLSTALNKYWRKIQGPLAKAFAHGKRKEKQIFDSLPSADFPWSAREVTRPLDLNRRGGIASIPEGGSMAKPSSVNAEEATYTAVHFNGRFSISDIAKFADRGQANQIAVQLRTQARQKIDAMVEHFSDYLHGSSTAVLATTDSDFSGTSQTLTLTAGYGNAAITNARFIAQMFKVGERLAFVEGGSDALINANAFGVVTSVNESTGVIAVTTDGAVSYTTNGIRVVKANNMEGTTLSGGTDFGRGLLGFEDLFNATTVAGVSGSTFPAWTPAYTSSAAGRFTHSKLRLGKDEIMNYGGLDADTLIVAQGVYRDMIAQERAGLRYDDAGGLSFDGDVKAKGLTIVSTMGVPPGHARLLAKAGLEKWEILPTTDRATWGELQPYENLAGAFGRIDWFGNIVPNNRKALAQWTAQTEA
jgi:hypothetical protein